LCPPTTHSTIDFARAIIRVRRAAIIDRSMIAPRPRSSLRGIALEESRIALEESRARIDDDQRCASRSLGRDARGICSNIAR
jgi:hypothetical protein